MKEYQKLYKYLPYFENLNNGEPTEGKQSFVLEAHPFYYNYAQEMEGFAKCDSEIGFVDYE
ncbi:hypothetical protein D4T97_003100 [Siminovitchia acidinfaciens]|uniref:Uncharacterized protein n=1 Tax=Siminovitchia acidinfaciens TaxID=2321395 RepID=A0A429Y7T1_9BACI|nr:hypothetical protein [Siminovitchia acidinfaciens]RST77485.1 hypothetical protein D4T97_003100 [Siminovitchia acidinfaciens]